ncbi:MAG TPA: hypothetical protein VHZ76_04035 [Gammaproteobacteria bacterium]|jgi:hypothetical protein|nr:hypothetical protein [Gammaproteobacteria bacterium]
MTKLYEDYCALFEQMHKNYPTPVPSQYVQLIKDIYKSLTACSFKDIPTEWYPFYSTICYLYDVHETREELQILVTDLLNISRLQLAEGQTEQALAAAKAAQQKSLIKTFLRNRDKRISVSDYGYAAFAGGTINMFCQQLAKLVMDNPEDNQELFETLMPSLTVTGIYVLLKDQPIEVSHFPGYGEYVLSDVLCDENRGFIINVPALLSDLLTQKAQIWAISLVAALYSPIEAALVAKQYRQFWTKNKSQDQLVIAAKQLKELVTVNLLSTGEKRRIRKFSETTKCFFEELDEWVRVSILNIAPVDALRDFRAMLYAGSSTVNEAHEYDAGSAAIIGINAFWYYWDILPEEPTKKDILAECSLGHALAKIQKGAGSDIKENSATCISVHGATIEAICNDKQYKTLTKRVCTTANVATCKKNCTTSLENFLISLDEIKINQTVGVHELKIPLSSYEGIKNTSPLIMLFFNLKKIFQEAKRQNNYLNRKHDLDEAKQAHTALLTSFGVTWKEQRDHHLWHKLKAIFDDAFDEVNFAYTVFSNCNDYFYELSKMLSGAIKDLFYEPINLNEIQEKNILDGINGIVDYLERSNTDYSRKRTVYKMNEFVHPFFLAMVHMIQVSQVKQIKTVISGMPANQLRQPQAITGIVHSHFLRDVYYPFLQVNLESICSMLDSNSPKGFLELERMMMAGGLRWEPASTLERFKRKAGESGDRSFIFQSKLEDFSRLPIVASIFISKLSRAIYDASDLIQVALTDNCLKIPEVVTTLANLFPFRIINLRNLIEFSKVENLSSFPDLYTAFKNKFFVLVESMNAAQFVEIATTRNFQQLPGFAEIFDRKFDALVGNFDQLIRIAAISDYYLSPGFEGVFKRKFNTLVVHFDQLMAFGEIEGLWELSWFVTFFTEKINSVAHTINTIDRLVQVANMPRLHGLSSFADFFIRLFNRLIRVPSELNIIAAIPNIQELPGFTQAFVGKFNILVIYKHNLMFMCQQQAVLQIPQISPAFLAKFDELIDGDSKELIEVAKMGIFQEMPDNAVVIIRRKLKKLDIMDLGEILNGAFSSIESELELQQRNTFNFFKRFLPDFVETMSNFSMIMLMMSKWRSPVSDEAKEYFLNAMLERLPELTGDAKDFVSVSPWINEIQQTTLYSAISFRLVKMVQSKSDFEKMMNCLKNQFLHAEFINNFLVLIENKFKPIYSALLAGETTFGFLQGDIFKEFNNIKISNKITGDVRIEREKLEKIHLLLNRLEKQSSREAIAWRLMLNHGDNYPLLLLRTYGIARDMSIFSTSNSFSPELVSGEEECEMLESEEIQSKAQVVSDEEDWVMLGSEEMQTKSQSVTFFGKKTSVSKKLTDLESQLHEVAAFEAQCKPDSRLGKIVKQLEPLKPILAPGGGTS